MHVQKNIKVERLLNTYPDRVQKKLLNLRKLILETAGGIKEITDIEETLKWGEPSYLTKNGSTIRFDWKKAKPNQYAIYFKCTSKLVPTFRKLFSDDFSFEGNRAIIFQMNDTVPVTKLKKCIRAALCYHNVKELPNLGIVNQKVKS